MQPATFVMLLVVIAFALAGVLLIRHALRNSAAGSACPRCGHANEAAARYCARCGTSLRAEAPAPKVTGGLPEEAVRRTGQRR